MPLFSNGCGKVINQRYRNKKFMLNVLFLQQMYVHASDLSLTGVLYYVRFSGVKEAVLAKLLKDMSILYFESTKMQR